jgi:Flp pilus assembly protein TadG
MALVMLLLFTLLFGVMEYGWMFLKMQEITNAARQGARLAITPDVNSASDINDPQASPSPSPIKMLQDAKIPVRGGTVSVSPVNVTPGTLVTVEVVVPYEDVELFHFKLLPKPAMLRASVSMMKEGY